MLPLRRGAGNKASAAFVKPGVLPSTPALNPPHGSGASPQLGSLEPAASLRNRTLLHTPHHPRPHVSLPPAQKHFCIVVLLKFKTLVAPQPSFGNICWNKKQTTSSRNNFKWTSVPVATKPTASGVTFAVEVLLVSYYTINTPSFCCLSVFKQT